MACTRYRTRGDKYIMEKVKVHLNTTCCWSLPITLQTLTKYFKPHTHIFGLEIHSGEVTRKQPQQRLSLLHVTTYWSLPMRLLNIIKICLSVSKLWSAQDFVLRGDNYITKKKKVISLARYTPTGPPLHFYQILS